MESPTRCLSVWLLAVIAATHLIRGTSGDGLDMSVVTKPNVILFVVDDMEWLDQFKEFAPKGVDLEGRTVEYPAFPTPNIRAFRNEAVIFPKSYCGGPKCAPSRYSMLTGRQPARSASAIELTPDDHAAEGTDVTVSTTKISGYDAEHNVARVLQNNSYFTGAVGKWHLMTTDNNGYTDKDCESLTWTPSAEKYEECTEIVKEHGFSFVDGWFYTNIATHDDMDFSHNPEWMVSRAQAFIDEAVDVERKPFFLYFASTLTHSAGDVHEALTTEEWEKGSPKGTLSDSEVATTMLTRKEIWNWAKLKEGSFPLKTKYARYYWLDQQFGALIEFLRNKGIYDETMVILQSDHGMGAKGTLYDHGSRILNFVRYPPLFGTRSVVLSDDLVVSNVDLAATIFDLAEVAVPDSYTMDGVSWLDEVTDAVNGWYSTGGGCCEYRFIDIFNSRSIMSSKYQYIWRANEEVESNNNVDDLYPNMLDEQQLYDLDADPDQKVNLIEDGSLSSIVTMFQSMMRDYVESTCPVVDGECLLPPLTANGDVFCTEIVSVVYRFFGVQTVDEAARMDTLKSAEDRFSSDDPDCAVQEYFYSITKYGVHKMKVSMEICCGDDGASFPDDYAPPNGYSHSGDAVTAP